MFYALNSENQMIHVSAADLSQKYYCPVCHQLVKLRTGKLNSKHFAHEQVSFSKQHHETNVHQAGKKLLMKWGSELGYAVQSEIYFKKIKRRADVIFKLPRSQVAVEYQCSPISPTKLTKRSQAYFQTGMR